MTREEVKSNMDIISAFADGKTIQYKKEFANTWEDLTEKEGLPMNTLAEQPHKFRIKPSPTYRPFANAEECWQEMLKHQPVGYLKRDEEYFILTKVGKQGTRILNYELSEAYGMAFERFTFADGHPFGVKVESEERLC